MTKRFEHTGQLASRRLFLLTLLSILLSTLVSCGGGTRGTGAEVSGQVRSNVSGEVLQGVLVEVSAFDVDGVLVDMGSVLTDENGLYSVFLENPGVSLQLRVAQNGAEGITDFVEISSEAEKVTVDLSIAQDGKPEITDVVVQEPEPQRPVAGEDESDSSSDDDVNEGETDRPQRPQEGEESDPVRPEPTATASERPTMRPTASPTRRPTAEPTREPTPTPTVRPSRIVKDPVQGEIVNNKLKRIV